MVTLTCDLSIKTKCKVVSNKKKTKLTHILSFVRKKVQPPSHTGAGGNTTVYNILNLNFIFIYLNFTDALAYICV